MANKKELKKLKAEEKQVVAAGVVYRVEMENETRFYVPTIDGDIKIFQNEIEAIKFSEQQGWGNNDVVECVDEMKATEECTVDSVANMFLQNLQDFE